jgi:hypothetical protein
MFHSLTQKQFTDLFLLAVALYDNYLIAEPQTDKYQLVARAVEKAQLPIVLTPQVFYTLIVVYHRTTPPLAEATLRFVWLSYVHNVEC